MTRVEAVAIISMLAAGLVALGRATMLAVVLVASALVIALLECSRDIWRQITARRRRG